MRTLTTGTAALLLAASLAVTLTSCSADGNNPTVAPQAKIPAGLAVEGYAIASPDAATAAAEAFDRSEAAIDTVGVSGVAITAGGAGVAPSDESANSLREAAQSAGKKAELLVVNAGQDGFSGELATQLLSSRANREFVVSGLTGEVVNGGWDGVQIDFESLSAADAPGLVDFAAELRDALPDDATISMAVQPSTDPSGYGDLGYDLAALSDSVDRFVLMAYDQHGTGFSEPGPVGGLPWVGQVLDAALELVPADRLDLGVAGYGYRWTGEGAAGGAVSVAEARTGAQSTGSWDAEQAEYTASPGDGSTLWWSDGRSITARADLAESKGLHGVAIWQLTTGDPIRRG